VLVIVLFQKGPLEFACWLLCCIRSLHWSFRVGYSVVSEGSLLWSLRVGYCVVSDPCIGVFVLVIVLYQKGPRIGVFVSFIFHVLVRSLHGRS
jgi:hypothetical protein